MKNVTYLLFFVCLCNVFNGFSQTTTPTDFFAGKWEIMIKGAPNGDTKWITNLIRKDGKLTGELVDPTDTTSKGKRAITKVVEEATNKISIFFESSQGGEISIDLTKKDDNNLTGSLMSFDVTAKRLN